MQQAVILTPRRLSNKLMFLYLIFFGSYVHAQMVMPSAYSSTTPLNYSRSWTATAPIQVPDSLRSRPVNDVKTSTTYFDALGRPIQTVLKQASPSKKDLVVPALYDSFSRRQYNFLPFVSSALTVGDSASDGGFKLDAFQQDSAFNKTQFPGETYYYGKTDFESSPASTALKSFSPGNSWMGSKGSGSEKSAAYQFLYNTVSDSVRIWTIAMAIGSIPVSSAYYQKNQLAKQIVTDEAGHQTITYTNPLGQLVLKKRQLTASPGTAHVGWLCTYYVYDDLGNARFVIQPRCVELINASWTITASLASELCFRFEYNARHQPIIQKNPGAGEIDVVYDARSRIVMQQDSNLRASGKWMVVEYDAENRPYRGGLFTDANTRAYHQNLANSSTAYPNTASNYEVLTQTYFDDYSWVSGTGTTLGTAIDATNLSNSSYFITGYNASPTYSQAIVQNIQTRGMATGARVKVVGTASQYLYQESFFDDHGRTIQSQSINVTGGKDEATVQYSFAGQVLRTYIQHAKSGTNPQTHSVLNKLTYDSAGRATSLTKNVDNTGDQLIGTYSYNELGQLKNKALGNNLENLAYAYNIRGWLSTINKDYISGASTTNYFGLELGYDKTASVAGTTSYTTAEFDGNISGTVWKSKGDGIGRKYDYIYDNSDRITAASFVQNTTGSGWNNSTLDFSMGGISYDADGNILKLSRKGFKLGGSTNIDSLVYTYALSNQSNRLTGVVDLANDTSAKLGDFQYNPATKQSTDYTYDGNGNQVSDNNRVINATTYNFLNLAQQFHVNGKGNIQYVYAASGERLQKIVVDSAGNKKTTTTYIGGFIYQANSTLTGTGNDTLQMISHEEGRIRWAFHKYTTGVTAYKYEYDYFVRDNQNNTRVILTQEKDTANYLATMEAAYRSTETALFNNIAASSFPRNLISGYPSDPVTSPNDSVAHLNGSGQKTGPSLLLKVMSGDNLDIAVHSFYTSMTGTGTNSSLTDVMNSLANGIVNVTAGGKGSVAQLTNPAGTLYGAVNSFLTTNDPNPSGKPKAYLNWILLDDQLNPVSTYPQTGAIPVGNFTAGTLGTPGQTGIPITKSGYLYVWVSNETTGWDVYFDNLSVVHHTGPLLEENHYYPFGLAMAAISSKALKTNYYENKFRFNGGSEMQNKEFSDGSGLELYETPMRGYDAQIGRFGQIDPMSKSYLDYSSYAYVANNPILFSDPSGARRIQIKPPVDNTLDASGRSMSGGGGSAFGGDVGTAIFNTIQTNVVAYMQAELEAEVENYNQQVAWNDLTKNLDAIAAGMTENTLSKLKEDNGNWSTKSTVNVDGASFGTNKNGESVIRYTFSGLDPNSSFTSTDLHQNYQGVITGVGTVNLQGISGTGENAPNSAFTMRDNSVNANTLLTEFLTGTGPAYSGFGQNHPMTNDLKKSYVVGLANAEFILKKGQAMHNFDVPFGLVGPVFSSTLTEQFVGGCRISIIPTSAGLLYILNNTTDQYSAFYHDANSVPRDPTMVTPGGTIYQRFIWFVK